MTLAVAMDDPRLMAADKPRDRSSGPRPGGAGVFVRRGLVGTETPASLRGSYLAAVKVPAGQQFAECV